MYPAKTHVTLTSDALLAFSFTDPSNSELGLKNKNAKFFRFTRPIKNLSNSVVFVKTKFL